MRLLVTGGSGFIGTNLIEHAAKLGCEIANLDIRPPLQPRHACYWSNCNILNRRQLIAFFRNFRPDHVVHLAARTDTATNDPLEAYADNTVGTANVLEATKAAGCVARLIITSTQFVCRPGFEPRHDNDYRPHTIYGQSKVIAEKMTREAGLQCCWTIIRPTTIWGPWSLRHRDGFFRVLRRGLYLHPGQKPCVRSYGYVGNVVDQIFQIFGAQPESVAGKTLYVGDRPIVLLEWVDGFSRALTGNRARVAPRWFIQALGRVGDAASRLTHHEFAITSTRFKSMTEDYVVNMEPTFELLGEPRHGMNDGIEATVGWFMTYEFHASTR